MSFGRATDSGSPMPPFVWVISAIHKRQWPLQPVRVEQFATSVNDLETTKKVMLREYGTVTVTTYRKED